MLQIERWKIVLIITLSVLGILYALPNVLPGAQQAWLEQHMPGWAPNKTVNLGLDLRGGSHLLFEADTAAVLANRMKLMKTSAVAALRKENIFFDGMTVKQNGISFRVKDPGKDGDAAQRIARNLEKLANVDMASDGTINITLDQKAIDTINVQVIDQAIEIVRKRVDESGTKEPVIQRQGSNRIVLQLPGVSDPTEVKNKVGNLAHLTFHLMDEDAMTNGQLSIDGERLPVHNIPGRLVPIKREVVLDGNHLTDAQPSFDQNGSATISFKFDAQGTRIFCDITRANVGKPFAAVLDSGPDKDGHDRKEIITDPVINEPICGGQGQISGRFDVKETNDISLLLRTGALPAPLNVVEERTVGPTLGSDSIAAGKTAAVCAFIAVFALMAASYGLFGLFANFALVLNIIFIFAILSMLQATLTLPGIAGIILTIGIAVDANVLIYERIREEIRNGRSPISAIDKGYQHAKGTIIDANVTTLIVALILFSFGSGPVKGFAVAMTIGIITSIFCALMLTRLIIITWLRQTKPSELHL